MSNLAPETVDLLADIIRDLLHTLLDDLGLLVPLFILEVSHMRILPHPAPLPTLLG